MYSLKQSLIGILAFFTVYSSTANALEPSDVSILFPVKPSLKKDEIFGMEGDGFCNLPSLTGEEKSVLPEVVFNAFATIALRRSGNGECNTGRSLTSILEADETLMKRGMSLVLERGVPKELCQPKLWRVVAMRFDPCANSLKRSNNKSLQGCVIELRLTAQPFVTVKEKGTRLVFDDALHLLFRVDSVPDILKGLNKIADKKKEAVTAIPWAGTEGVLSPHPGLRAEMNRCDGPVAQEIRSFVETFARPEKLKRVAYMLSSESMMQWTFAMDEFNGSAFTISPTNTGPFDNFSLQSFQAGSPLRFATNPTIHDLKTTPHIGDLLKHPGFLSGVALDEKTSRPFRATLNDIMNPRKASNGGSSCVSCHMSDQLLTDLNIRAGVPNAAGPRPFLPRPHIWPGFTQKTRSFLSFRNFGYDAGFEFGVSLRTQNDTNDVLRVLKDAGF